MVETQNKGVSINIKIPESAVRGLDLQPTIKTHKAVLTNKGSTTVSLSLCVDGQSRLLRSCGSGLTEGICEVELLLSRRLLVRSFSMSFTSSFSSSSFFFFCSSSCHSLSMRACWCTNNAAPRTHRHTPEERSQRVSTFLLDFRHTGLSLEKVPH